MNVETYLNLSEKQKKAYVRYLDVSPIRWIKKMKAYSKYVDSLAEGWYWEAKGE